MCDLIWIQTVEGKVSISGKSYETRFTWMHWYAAVAAVLRHDPSVRGLAGGLPTDSITTAVWLNWIVSLLLKRFQWLLLPQEWSAAQRRVPLNTYWDHTTACMFEKDFIHLFWRMMHVRHGSYKCAMNKGTVRAHFTRQCGGIVIWKI